MKAIAFIRTSTDVQGIDQQQKELIEYIEKDGIKADEIVTIGRQGASAIKEEDKYLELIEQVKETIAKDKSIICVYCWEVSRIARHRSTFYVLIDFLKANRVNLKIMKPSISLYNPKGEIDRGADMAIGLYVSFAEMEMETKSERFKRARREAEGKGLFDGGSIPYGYKVEDKKIVIDEETAPIVKPVFALYATGDYSHRKLAKEMQQRGVKRLTERMIDTMLANPNYIGELKPKVKRKRKYEPIISNSLWEQCRKIATEANTQKDKSHKHHFFATKLIVCGECGKHLTAAGNQGNYYNYRCCNYECKTTWGIGVSIVDGLLWWIASEEEASAIADNNARQKELYRKQIEVLQLKLESIEDLMANYKTKKERIMDAWIEDNITKEKRDSKLKGVEDEIKQVKENNLKWREEIERLERLIKAPNNNHKITMKAVEEILTEDDEKEMQTIVRKHIKEVRVEINTADKHKFYTIEISLYNGKECEYIYKPYNKNRLFTLNSKGEEIAMLYEPYIFRIGDKCYTIDTYQKHVPRGQNATIDNIIKRWLSRLDKANKEYAEGLKEYEEGEEYQRRLELMGQQEEERLKEQHDSK